MKKFLAISFVLITIASFLVFFNPQQVFEENIARLLYSITAKYSLPERFAIEAYEELKRKKSKFRSENDAIKVLIKILSKDENYIHNKQLRMIKARYEKVPGN